MLVAENPAEWSHHRGRRQFPPHRASDIGAWQLSDTPADEIMLGDTRAAIMRHVREHEGDRPKRIAEATGLDAATAQNSPAAGDA